MNNAESAPIQLSVIEIAHEDDARRHAGCLQLFVLRAVPAQLAEVAREHVQLPGLPSGAIGRRRMRGAGGRDDPDRITGIGIARDIGLCRGGRRGRRQRRNGDAAHHFPRIT
ncbi:hypothetical protein QP150_05960 [Sphingomonas sp. 22L2VL55-3]